MNASSSSVSGPGPTPANPKSPVYSTLTHYGAVDWAKGHHDLCVVDRAGGIVFELSIDDTPQGWAGLRARLAAMIAADGAPAIVGFTIETSCGPAVERLLEADLPVFPLNPMAAERYRDRKAPSGHKNDRLDAFSFADALRTDGHLWRVLCPQDALTKELRMLCRDEITLIEQRTALVNQIQAALNEYYPTALSAFDDWTVAAAWEFILAFPTPHQLASAGKRKWEKFLHVHKLFRQTTYARRMELFAAAGRAGSPSRAVTSAKSLLAVSIARQLQTLQTQLDEYRARINELFNQHPDHDLFGSLPGAGEKLAPRLLAELGADRSVFADSEALQCFAGAAPVTYQSGSKRRVLFRRACNPTLRATVHLWADRSRMTSPWAEAYYRQKKEQGMGHAAALRCLAMRWLKILWKMWMERKPYDADRHLRDQTSHGSWVIALLPQAEPQPG